jgi:hypothetical protein
MTWTTDIKHELKHKYNIVTRVSENFKPRYKKYHRACFEFINPKIGHGDDGDVYYNRYLYNRKDIQKSLELKKYINKNLGPNVLIRNDFYGDFVYFDNLTYLLDNIPQEFHKHIHSLEIMAPDFIKQQHTDFMNIPGEITFCTKLPFDKYKYQVYIVTSASERKKIGHSNLLHLRNVIEAYNGIKGNNTFTESHKHSWYVPETYFYAKTLDWLPMIQLMEPRYIRKIKQYKTRKEVKNENSD